MDYFLQYLIHKQGISAAKFKFHQILDEMRATGITESEDYQILEQLVIDLERTELFITMVHEERMILLRRNSSLDRLNIQLTRENEQLKEQQKRLMDGI